MFFDKLRKDLNALAALVAKTANSLVDGINGHTERIKALELKVVTLMGELEKERRARLEQANSIHDHFVQVEKTVEALDEDLSELVDGLFDVLSDEDSLPPENAIPCKITLVEKKKDFDSALAEAQADIKKAKKRRKGKKKA